MYSLGTVLRCGNDEKEGEEERERERESRTQCKGGNKGRVGWDATILQHGRYVGIASRGSLSRTANYGIMHTAGPVPQLWLCYEFVLTQGSPCRRNGCARRRTAATCTTELAVGRLSRDIYGEKGVKAHCVLGYWFARLLSLSQSVLHSVTCKYRTYLLRKRFSVAHNSFLKILVYFISAYRLHKTVEMQSL